jgi:hypothetical protein
LAALWRLEVAGLVNYPYDNDDCDAEDDCAGKKHGAALSFGEHLHLVAMHLVEISRDEVDHVTLPSWPV